MRMDELQVPPGPCRTADIHNMEFLGAGTFGRVLLGDLFIGKGYYGLVVIKFAIAGSEEQLATEARVYSVLSGCYGISAPGYHGYFSSDYAGTRYSCIVLDFCGVPVRSFNNLSLLRRWAVYLLIRLSILMPS